MIVVVVVLVVMIVVRGHEWSNVRVSVKESGSRAHERREK